MENPRMEIRTQTAVNPRNLVLTGTGAKEREDGRRICPDMQNCPFNELSSDVRRNNRLSKQLHPAGCGTDHYNLSPATRI